MATESAVESVMPTINRLSVERRRLLGMSARDLDAEELRQRHFQLRRIDDELIPLWAKRRMELSKARPVDRTQHGLKGGFRLPGTGRDPYEGATRPEDAIDIVDRAAERAGRRSPRTAVGAER